MDKAGMRDTGGEGLKRRNCWDLLLLATVEDGLPVSPLWVFTSISMRCPNILPRCRPDLTGEGCQSLNLRCPHPDFPRSSCNGCHFEICLWGNSRNTLKASNTLTSSQICLAPRLLQKYPPKITKVSYQTPKTDRQKIGGRGGGGEDWGGDRWREEGVGDELGSHCNVTGPSPTRASAALLLKKV